MGFYKLLAADHSWEIAPPQAVEDIEFSEIVQLKPSAVIEYEVKGEQQRELNGLLLHSDVYCNANTKFTTWRGTPNPEDCKGETTWNWQMVAVVFKTSTILDPGDRISVEFIGDLTEYPCGYTITTKVRQRKTKQTVLTENKDSEQRSGGSGTKDEISSVLEMKTSKSRTKQTSISIEKRSTSQEKLFEWRSVECGTMTLKGYY
jgi:hypothetical protein